MNVLHPFRRLTIRSAVLLGFGVILGVWLLSGFYFARRTAAVAAESAAINERYMQGQEQLATVRAQILLASVYVRDALLDPNPGATIDYRRQVSNAFQIGATALERYRPVLSSEQEQKQIDQLRREVETFHTTLFEVLDSDSTRWPDEARTLLRSRIVPRREEVIRVSEEVQSINRSTFVQQQEAAADVYRSMQRGTWTGLGLALVASFAIGLFAARHAGRLERDLWQQRGREAETRKDLQRLSAQLITAQEEERRNIARELHDEVGQVLTAIKVELAVASHAVEAAGGPSTALNGARSLTEGAIQTVRDLSQLLRPAVLDDLGLPAAIGSYLREYGRRHDIRVELLQERMDERLSPDTEAAAYRIVQEALTNVARHAKASRCRVYLQRLANTVLVTVEDDGIGFDAPATEDAGRREGLGILGIRERVVQLGGTLRLESTLNKGTRLTVELPATIRPAENTDETADSQEARRPAPEVMHG